MEKLKLLEEPHPHPLTFIEGRINSREEMFCCVCKTTLYPPAFICSPCKFYIHQSCIDLPSQIRNRFHPHHPLYRALINSDHCHCCWQMPRDCVYTCTEPHCNFNIDIKCILANTKHPGLNLMPGKVYQHFSHSHPLILEEQITSRKLIVCHLCEMLLVSGPAYFCSICDIRFHKRCAELPREIMKPDRHHHPLFLFPHRTVQSFCNTCNNQCSWFVYSCVHCNFNLHVMCLLSSHHKHNFTRLRTKMRFQCLLCGWGSSLDFPWFCSICHILAHKECAELPSSLLVVGHDCPLYFTYSHPVEDQSKLACEICRKKVEPQFAAYSCSKCRYVVHLSCASRNYLRGLVEHDWRTSNNWSLGDEAATLNNFSNELEEVGSVETLHSNCEQELILCKEECDTDRDKQCHGCMRRFSDTKPSYSYSCVECGFFLHKECADLPITKRHPLHKHPLTLITIQDVAFQCHACLQFCHGYAYHCEECLYTLDVRCVLIKTKKLKHPSHQHLLSLAQNKEDQRCWGCGQSNKTMFECDDGCNNFSLDYRCATLPQKVRCRFDGDSMDLSFSVEDETGEYYCDVCEEERNPTVCFYYCKTCRLAAHPECILGEYPWLKYGSYETHKHLLALVTEGKMNYSDCGHCGKPCAGNLAYECSRCKFNVHAIGHCYHEQILQHKLSFKIK